jgi:putative PEP-CTERM system TPR-repeat lipoprotein
VLIVLFAAVFIGCNKDISKHQYYEKGVQYLKSGNANGAIIAFKKAIENDQNYFEARYQLGLAYLAQKKYDSAEKEFLKVLRLNPSFQTTHIALAKTYLNKLKVDDAIKEAKLYLDKNSDNPEAFEVAASAYALKNDFLTAEEYLYKSLKFHPDRIDTKIMLADVYLTSGKITGSEALINEVISLEGKNKDALYVFARIKKLQGRTEDLINIYLKIIETDPNDMNAHLDLGFTYLQGKKIGLAESISDKMQKARKDNAEALYLKGAVRLNQGKIEEALALLQKSLKIKALPGTYYFLGLCRFENGDLEQATGDFQKVIDLRPDMIQPRLLLTAIHLKKGRPEEAEKEAKKALSIDDKNAVAHNLLGSVYLAQGKGDMAMEEFDRALELNPQLVDAHIKKGTISLESGNDQMAETEFLNAVKIAPEVLNIRIMLAKYYIKREKFHEAVNILKQGLKGNESDAVIYNIIGAAYLGAKDMENSRQNFEKAISANPKIFLPYYNLALLYLNKGEKEMAVKEYKKILDIDKRNVAALLMLAKVMDADKKDKEALSFYMKAKETGEEIAYLSLAGYYQAKSDDKQALKVLHEALSFDPRYKHAKEMIGRLLISEKNYKEAILVSKDLKESSPEMGAEMTADVYMAMGEYDKAVNEMKGLLIKDNKRIDILVKIVNLYIKKKDFINAEKTARDIISSKPQGDAGYLILSSVYMENHQFREALDAVKKALELNPGNIETRAAIGRIYISMKELQKASEIFEELERSTPKYVPAFFYQAQILEQKGQKKDAAEKYNELLKLSPNYAPALNNLAYLFIEGYGPIDKAVEMSQKAKKLMPGDGGTTDTLGWALYHAGKYDEALTYLIEATYYLPGEPAVRYHLALVYLKKGIQDKAEEQLKNSIRLGRISPFSELQEAQANLSGMKKK